MLYFIFFFFSFPETQWNKAPKYELIQYTSPAWEQKKKNLLKDGTENLINDGQKLFFLYHSILAQPFVHSLQLNFEVDKEIYLI